MKHMSMMKLNTRILGRDLGGPLGLEALQFQCLQIVGQHLEVHSPIVTPQLCR